MVYLKLIDRTGGSFFYKLNYFDHTKPLFDYSLHLFEHTLPLFITKTWLALYRPSPKKNKHSLWYLLI